MFLMYILCVCVCVRCVIMSVIRKEMEKYRDIDEDDLLKKLTEEELQRLENELEELDPDV